MGIRKFIANTLVILFFPIILITEGGVWIINKIRTRTKQKESSE